MEDRSYTKKYLSQIRSAMAGMGPGAVGGLCCVIVGHPIDLVKVRMQTMTTSAAAPIPTSPLSAPLPPRITGGTFATLSTIFATEGVSGLYRGVTAPLLAIVPAFMIAFWSNDLAQNFFIGQNGGVQPSSLQHVLAGGFSGLPMAFVIGPSERVKCLLQVSSAGRYNGVWDCGREIVKMGGARSLFRGIGVTVARDVPGNAAFFGTYEIMRRNLMRAAEQREGGNNKFYTFFSVAFAGGCAGVANWLVAMPMDTVKSRFQTAEEGAFKNAREVFWHMLRNEGWLSLYRGIGPALIRAFPANVATFSGAEVARSMISRFD